MLAIAPVECGVPHFGAHTLLVGEAISPHCGSGTIRTHAKLNCCGRLLHGVCTIGLSDMLLLVTMVL